MRAWLLTHDPGLLVVRRAVRVAVATSAAFYLGRYLLDVSTVGLYAAFACVALGGLSEIAGTPRQRTTVMLAAAAVGAGLVTLGTYLSVSTVAATAGMVVVGFAVSFAGIGGPTVAGLANGWQLLYILPSFPPYDPGSLGQRLLGLGIGAVVLVLADRLLLPPPVPRRYEDVLAVAVDAVRDRLALLRPIMVGEVVPLPELEVAADTTRRVVDASRLSQQPMLQRPSGPSGHDRAMWATANATWLLAGRVDDLQTVLLRAADPPRPHRGDDVLAAAQRCATACADALRGGVPPDLEAIDAALSRAAAERDRWLIDAVEGDEPLARRIAVGTVTHELAESARVLARAVTVVVAGQLPRPGTGVDRGYFWYAGLGAWRLGVMRLRGQLTLRSVWFRNAIRVAVALGAARAVAGTFDLSHGFWVLLATLTLMRTTVSATRRAIVPAVLGTMLGAALAIPLLLMLGDSNLAMAALMPFLVAVAFAGGPILGAAYGQVGFTLVVAAIFSQVAPANWTLAGWRLADVVVGASIGVVAGVLAWPRGASGQLVAQCRDALHRSSAAMVAITAELTGSDVTDRAVEDPVAAARRSLIYAGETVAFAMTEPADDRPSPPWRELLGCCHYIVEGGQYLQLQRRAGGGLPWHDVGELLEGLVTDAAARARRLADALPDLPTARAPAPDDDITDWLRATVTGAVAPPGVIDVIDTRGWLVAVRRDLDRLIAR